MNCVSGSRTWSSNSGEGEACPPIRTSADPDVRYLVLGGWDDFDPRAPVSFILVDYLMSAGPASLGLRQALTDRGHQRGVGKDLRSFSLCPVLPCHGKKDTPDCAPRGTPASQRAEPPRACRGCGNPGRPSANEGRADRGMSVRSDGLVRHRITPIGLREW